MARIVELTNPPTPVKADVGVIIARFQTWKLTAGHLALLKKVVEHKRQIVFIGCSVVRGSHVEPLDFETRRMMVAEHLPKEAIILPLWDIKVSDEKWSQIVDQKIREIFPNNSIAMYAGRDSFAPHYHGKHTIYLIETVPGPSGTDLRAAASVFPINSEDFRKGVTYGQAHLWPNPKPTVDMVISNEDHTKLLFASNGVRLKFCGGFIDSTDKTAEHAAIREIEEECTLTAGDPQYVLSMLVDDLRYRKEKSKVMTTLFMTKYLFGEVKPGDDLLELGWNLRWVDVNEFLHERFPDFFVDSHRPLAVGLQDWIRKDRWRK